MTSRVRVQTPSGSVEGVEEAGVRVFRGIPYAESTAGEGRFRAPEPVSPWHETRDASQFAQAAPQPGGGKGIFRHLSPIPGAGVGEECLNLNLWAPTDDGAPRPVLVWLHGGGFSHGSGSFHLYSGESLARRGDVVVVTVNYRLGALGGLDLGSFAAGEMADSNLGLRDQVAALEWVRSHVDSFGGDPGNVTLFGQSAGAMSACTLMTTSAADGLFHRAILQSGAGNNVNDRARARRIAEVFLGELQLDPDRTDLVARLRAMDFRELLAAQARLGSSHGLALGQMAWQPVLDGEMVTESPEVRFQRGTAAKLPLLIGSNLDEWKMFTATDKKRRRLDESTLCGYLEQTFALGSRSQGDEELGVSARARAEEAMALYRVAPGGVSRSPGEIWASLQTDRVFHYPAVKLAEAHASHDRPTWFYRFDWKPPLAPRRVGACHSLELAFVFGTLRTRWLRPLFGVSPRAVNLSSRMQDAWLSFARDGDPNSHGELSWPGYTSGRGLAKLFGGRDEHDRAMDPALRQFWDAVEGA
ncbi:MAG: carboxylesterase family protein [Myxococcota bacterium]|jgi:para-nitrobenzyl esterase|nr:carboxylesterase family protein [Myxococcota bacterium]